MAKETFDTTTAAQKAINGDTDALNTLFNETYNTVYYFALKTVKDESAAADITQETFLTIFQSISTLSDAAAYPAWSRQITYRHCLQYFKKQGREIQADETEDGGTIFDTIEETRAEFIPEENLDKEDFKNAVMQIIDSLPEVQRTAIMLYYYDELSVRDIAEIQGVSEGTVKSRLNYGRKAIKSATEDYEKKHNVKLHIFGVLPLLLWLFASDAKNYILPAESAKATLPTLSTTAANTSSAATTKAATSAAAKGGSKIFSTLASKIIAGTVATVIVAGSVTTAVVISNNNKGKGDTGFAYEAILHEYTAEQELLQAIMLPYSWLGTGSAKNSSNVEYDFQLAFEKEPKTNAKGYIIINSSDEFDSFFGHFSGKGKRLSNGTIEYHLTLDRTIGVCHEALIFTEMTVIYNLETNTMEFGSDAPYEAKLDFYKNYLKK